MTGGTNKTILITGGAGFIGSFTAKFCAEAGFQVVVLDNLVTGRSDRARWGRFHRADIRDVELVRHILRTHRVSAVIHLAASTQVAESILNPAEYFSNNVDGVVALLDAMVAENVLRVVFASSCSVYGNTASAWIDEAHETHPVSPYGESKLLAESALQRCEAEYGLKSVSLRYFNVAGGDSEAGLGEHPDRSSRIIPRTFLAAEHGGAPLRIFGSSYDTRDGTAVRDYVHVSDIARANLLATEYLLANRPSTTLNIGAGTGSSVTQIVDEMARVLGKAVPVLPGDPRPGDPPYAVSDPSRANEVLGWLPYHSSLKEIVASAASYYRSIAAQSATAVPRTV